MENNMNTEANQTNTGNETQGKLFTQDEVNSFVQSRLSRERGQTEKRIKAEYNQKLAELQAREMKLLVKEKLDERGMSHELADVITCADENELKQKLDTLERIYGASKKEKQGGFRFGVPGNQGSGQAVVDPVRKAMGLERKE